MKRTTTVTHPDATVSKRTSKTMHYTWAVEVGPADPMMVAAQKEAQATANDEEAATLRAAVAEPRITIRDRGLTAVGTYNPADTYHSHAIALAGTDIDQWSNAKGETEHWINGDKVIMSALESLTRHALSAARSCDKRAEALRIEAAHIRANGIKGDGWTVYRWSTRADLAGNGAAEAAKAFAGQGRAIRVVPVD